MPAMEAQVDAPTRRLSAVMREGERVTPLELWWTWAGYAWPPER